MATRIVFLLVAVQGISAQCRGHRTPGAWGSPSALSASNGPRVTVASSSSIPPRGVSLSSETAIEGNLAVTGRLPFLGSVGLDGVVPSYGQGVVDYNTGGANFDIVKEETKTCGVFSPLAPKTNTIITDASMGITLAASGGDFKVSSGSHMTPNGIFVISENTFEGPVSVTGTLPFLSVVSFNDKLPTSGSGTVTYKCGDGLSTIFENTKSVSPKSGADATPTKSVYPNQCNKRLKC